MKQTFSTRQTLSHGAPSLQPGAVINYLPDKREYMVMVNPQPQRRREEKKSPQHSEQNSTVSKSNTKKINFSFSKSKKSQESGKEESECEVFRVDRKQTWERVRPQEKNRGPSGRTHYYSSYSQPYLFVYGGVS